MGTRHLELQVSVVRHRVKAGKRSTSEQRMVAAAEGDYIKNQVLALEVLGRAENNFQRYDASALCFHTGYDTLECGVTGFDS